MIVKYATITTVKLINIPLASHSYSVCVSGGTLKIDQSEFLVLWKRKRGGQGSRGNRLLVPDLLVHGDKSSSPHPGPRKGHLSDTRNASNPGASREFPFKERDGKNLKNRTAPTLFPAFSLSPDHAE